VVDDLAGTVHQGYGSMADPTYLIDADGRVAFYNMWTHAPTLRRALDDLLARGGRGVVAVAGGLDRAPHIAASFVDGWRGIRRGGPGGLLDFELAVPGGTSLTFLGDRAKPLLAPLVLRTTPLPAAVRLAFGGVLVAAVAFAVVRRRR
jgi:hypothetical protein